MSQGFTQPPGGTFGSSSGGFSGGQSGFGGGSQGGGFGGQPGGFGGPAGGTSGGFGGGSPSASFGGGAKSSPGSRFGSSPGGSGGGGRLQSAPVVWVAVGLALGLIGIGLNAWLSFGSLVATDGLFLVIAGIAWGLAGVVGALVIGMHMTEVNKRKATGFYTEDTGKKVLFNIAAVLLVIAVIWSAWDIALWMGKL